MKKLNLLGASALLCAMSATSAWAASDPVLFGYQGDMYGTAPRGLYTFTPTGSQADMLWRDQLSYDPDGSINTYNMLGGWIRNGRLCGYESYYPSINLSNYFYVERDLETGEVLVQKHIDTTGDNWGNVFLFSTYNPVDDRVYGYGYNKSQTRFVFKSAPADDLDQAVNIRVVEYSEMTRSMCFNEELGILVGITGGSSLNLPYKLVQIDVNTGEQTDLYTLNLSVQPDYDVVSGLLWIPARQGYVWNCYTTEQEVNTSNLTLIKPDKKSTEVLRTFESNYNFNYFVADGNDPEASTDSPKACTNLVSDFTEAGFEGTVTFTLPTELNNGQTITGNIDYKVYADNKEVDGGTGAPGATVTTKGFMLEDGSHFVRVVPEVDGKKGLADLTVVYVGQDLPAAPTNVTLTDKALTWDPVTKTAHGVDITGVTYEVVYNGNTIDEVSATSYNVEDVINPDGNMASYYFEVKAKYAGKVSKSVQSNSIIAGKSYTVPFTIEPTAAQFSVCTQEDTDGNKVGWTLDLRDTDQRNVLTSGFDKNMESEDWLFLPRFTAPADGVYTFSFNVALAQADLAGGAVEAWVGTAPDSKSMKTMIIPSMIQSDYDPISLSGSFVITPELAEARDLYIGLCVKSPQGTLSPLQFETLSLKKTVDNLNGPEAVSNLQVKGVEGKPLDATVSFTLPDRTLSGNPIPATYVVTAKIKTSNGITKTLTGAPGEAVEFTSEIGQGDFLVNVTPVVNGAEGLTSNVVAHLGFGLPGVVRNLRAEYDETNTKLTLNWDAPATDMEGNDSESDNFTYNVYQYDETEKKFVLAVTVPYPLTYATMDMSESDRLTNIDVIIAAVNAAGESPLTTFITAQVGKPFELPMAEDFNGDNFKYEPLIMFKGGDCAKAEVKWGSTEKLGLPEAMQSVEVGDVIAGTPQEEGAKSRIILPKFSTMGYDKVEGAFRFWRGENAATIRIAATAYPMASNAEELIYTVTPGDGYSDMVRFQLPDNMTNNPWVAVTINVDYPSMASRFVMVDYSFADGSGVEGIENNRAAMICGGDGAVFMTGLEGCEADIFTLDGRRVSSRKIVSNSERIAVAPGLYIVKAGSQAAKVVVR